MLSSEKTAFEFVGGDADVEASTVPDYWLRSIITFFKTNFIKQKEMNFLKHRSMSDIYGLPEGNAAAGSKLQKWLNFKNPEKKLKYYHWCLSK